MFNVVDDMSLWSYYQSNVQIFITLSSAYLNKSKLGFFLLSSVRTESAMSSLLYPPPLFQPLTFAVTVISRTTLALFCVVIWYCRFFVVVVAFCYFCFGFLIAHRWLRDTSLQITVWIKGNSHGDEAQGSWIAKNRYRSHEQPLLFLTAQ